VIVMSKRKPRRSAFMPLTEEPGVTTVIVWESPRDPSRKPPGRPPNVEAFAKAIAYVLARQAKSPNAKLTPLAQEAADEFHVSRQRVIEAVKTKGKR
jgi:hypothetical protein